MSEVEANFGKCGLKELIARENEMTVSVSVCVFIIVRCVVGR